MRPVKIASSIRWFKNITKKDVLSVGGKGASLGEMTNAGLPVPPGFVIASQAFDTFLQDNELNEEVDAQIEHVNMHDMKSVEETSRILRSLINRGAFDAQLQKDMLAAFKKLGSPRVAVRSSATAEDSSAASWAGELETYLNTTNKTLLENIKHCWGSLFTPRAIVYRCEKNLHTCPVSVAVVVQAMIQSEVSGICFTVHPVTEDRNQMIIEAGWGLGEAIVSGQITPDSYVIDKRSNTMIGVSVSTQEKALEYTKNQNAWVSLTKNKKSTQKLNNAQIKKLANICLNIERHYGFPCDIEWAYAKGNFYITQSRPITTLK